MTTTPEDPLGTAELDHVRIATAQLGTARGHLCDGYGFQVHAVSDPVGDGDVRVAALRAGGVRVLLEQPLADTHPAAAYLDRHGDGVRDIAFAVPDVERAWTAAVDRGAVPVTPPATRWGRTTATIGGFGDITHTFVEASVRGTTPPGLRPVPTAVPGDGPLAELDHFAVCVPPGELTTTVEHYRDVLGFEVVFSEHLVIGEQAMTTTVVQSASGSITFTLIEPDATRPGGHIHEFLADHGGAGVQHIAFSTGDIVGAVRRFRGNGVEFLPTPGSYYERLRDRVVPQRHGLDVLRGEQVLVDEDHDGQLYQIFARSVHDRGTIFFELVERCGARTFGSGNITALYEAAERDRTAAADRSAA